MRVYNYSTYLCIIMFEIAVSILLLCDRLSCRRRRAADEKRNNNIHFFMYTTIVLYTYRYNGFLYIYVAKSPPTH